MYYTSLTVGSIHTEQNASLSCCADAHLYYGVYVIETDYVYAGV